MYKRFDVRKMIDALPHGLDRAILLVLSNRWGRNQAISRTNLVKAVAQMGFPVNERAVRLQISQLRKQGALIGSAPGEDGGYYLVVTAQEFQEFVDTEYLAKIKDMQETLSAMRQSAREVFGEAWQASFF
jgi:DNA-binding transcriptional regulator PaaX